jgi:hypothetical protein
MPVGIGFCDSSVLELKQPEILSVHQNWPSITGE